MRFLIGFIFGSAGGLWILAVYKMLLSEKVICRKNVWCDYVHWIVRTRRNESVFWAVFTSTMLFLPFVAFVVIGVKIALIFPAA